MPVYGQSGWELLCRNLAIALHKLGVRCWLDPKLRWNLERVPMEQEDAERLMEMEKTSIDDTCPVIFQQVPFDDELDIHKLSKKKVCLSLFETDRCPKPWIKQFKRIDEVWTYTDFNFNYWKEDVPNLRKIPLAFDKDYGKGMKPAEIISRKKYIFFANGDFTERKGFDILLQAFILEFSSKEDVCLVLKTHFGGFHKYHQNLLFDKFKEYAGAVQKEDKPKIYLFGSKMPIRSMPCLYKAIDCYVLPTRGEGFGLPFLEAKICEKEVIATNWGGHTEFLNDKNAHLLDYKLEIMDDINYIKKCPNVLNHKWAIVHVDDLRKKMREVYNGSKKSEPVTVKGWQEQALWVVKRLFGNGTI